MSELSGTRTARQVNCIIEIKKINGETLKKSDKTWENKICDSR